MGGNWNTNEHMPHVKRELERLDRVEARLDKLEGRCPKCKQKRIKQYASYPARYECMNHDCSHAWKEELEPWEKERLK